MLLAVIPIVEADDNGGPPLGSMVPRPFAPNIGSAGALRVEMEGLVGGGIDSEVAQLENDNIRGGNTAAYNQSQLSQERKFFETINKYGGVALHTLLNRVPSNYSNGTIIDYHFFNAVGGNKDDDKKWTLNKCLSLCAIKYVLVGGSAERRGLPLQPNSFVQHMKLLFYVLNSKGIKFDFVKDFNKKGEFHGLVITVWEKARSIDSSFGTKPNEAQFMEDSDKRVMEALREGVFDLDKAQDLLEVVMYIIGRYCALRGNKEQHELKTEHVFLGRYSNEDASEDLCGLRYVGIWMPWSKTVKLSFKKTVASDKKKALITVVENLQLGIVNPYPILVKYLSHLHPDSERFISKPCDSDARMAEYKKEYPTKDVLYYPSIHSIPNYNIGRNKITAFQKGFAQRCGAAKLEQMHWTRPSEVVYYHCS